MGPTFISLSKGRLEPWESGLAGVQTNKWAVIWGKHAGDPGTGLPRLVCTVGAGGQANRERGSWRARPHLYGQTGMAALVGRLGSILAKGEGLQGWGVGARSPHVVLGQPGIRSGYGEVAGNHHHAPLQGPSWCLTQEETQVWPWGGSVLYLSSPLHLSPYSSSGPRHQRRAWKGLGFFPGGPFS